MSYLQSVDINRLNSMTKYPSIPTYHTLDKSNGMLTDEVVSFDTLSHVIGTEKIDGTNARIILLPDGSYVIGSRDQLLYAKDDQIVNPTLGIVDALHSTAERCRHPATRWAASLGALAVLYVEVFGGRVSSGSKQYTGSDAVSFRLFDVAQFPDNFDAEVLSWPVEQIAAWRDHGGQQFLTSVDRTDVARECDIELVPRLFTRPSFLLPSSIEGMQGFLLENLPRTNVALDDGAGGRAEGIVFRSSDRRVIAKARIQDYERTLRRGKK